MSGSDRGHRKRFPCAAFVLGILVSGVPFVRAQEELRTPRYLDDPKSAAAIVATVGDLRISAREFLLSYEFGPAFVKQLPHSRQRYLNYMINEKLLALEGYREGLQRSERVKASLAELEGDMATEQLYRDDVLSKVKITPAEIAQGVHDQRFHYKVQWLFCSSAEERKRTGDSLRAGVPFDALFRRQLTGGVKAEDRSMEQSLFRIRRTSPMLAGVIDTLKENRPSLPVKGPDGWYIFKLVDGWVDALLTETQTTKLAADARAGLTQQKADSLSDRYVRAMMLAENPVIVRITFDKMRAYIGSLTLPAKQYAEWDLTKRFRDEGDSVDVKDIDRYGDDTLVTLKSGVILLKDFLRWYRHRDTYIRLQQTSPQAFFLSLEDLVWKMVRDRLLVDRAYRRGLQNRPAVQNQLKWWEDKIVYDLLKANLRATVPVDDSTAARYYQENLHRYRDVKGNIEHFDNIRDVVRKQLYASELRKVLLQRASDLKKIYPVKIREDVLSSLPVEDENDPKAIDVYTVKKGGTFPHPAFPIIDYEWGRQE